MATIHDESLCDLDAGKVLQLNAPNYDQIDVLVARPICIYSRCGARSGSPFMLPPILVYYDIKYSTNYYVKEASSFFPSN